MSHEAAIHEAQTKILRELLFIPSTSFAELHKVSGLEADHAKFHIKRLVELGYIEKINTKYQLSIKGKEYANKLDTEAGVIERQPKSAVMLMTERIVDGRTEYLVQQRLKHPMFGYWGLPTGKIRWGESILETAARELMEETGLSGSFEHRGIYHERVEHGDTSEIVEDKIFHVMRCTDATGTMLETFEGGRNVWRTFDDVNSEEKRYKSFEKEMRVGIDAIPFTETLYIYGKDEF